MSTKFTVDKETLSGDDTPRFVPASASEKKRVKNVGGSTLNYDNDRATAIAGGSGVSTLASGASVVVENGVWLHSAGQTSVSVEDITGVDAHALDTAAAHAVEDWTLVAEFAGDWANVETGSGSAATDTNPVRYLKDPLGFVHLAGAAASVAGSGSGGSDSAFTLPVGYRPEYAQSFPSGDTGDVVAIGTDGVVNSSDDATIRLDGIVFRAA